MYLITNKSGNIFRVGGFLDFVRLATRTEGPHGAYVRGDNQTKSNWPPFGVKLNGLRRVRPRRVGGKDAKRQRGLRRRVQSSVRGGQFDFVSSPARAMHPMWGVRVQLYGAS